MGYTNLSSKSEYQCHTSSGRNLWVCWDEKEKKAGKMMRGVMERAETWMMWRVTGVRTLVKNFAVFDSTNQTEQLQSKRGAPTLSPGKILTQNGPFPSYQRVPPRRQRRRIILVTALPKNKNIRAVTNIEYKHHRPWGGCAPRRHNSPRAQQRFPHRLHQT